MDHQVSVPRRPGVHRPRAELPGRHRARPRLSERTHMGQPDSDPGLFRKCSQRCALASVRAPVVVTGGAHAPRCAVTEARAMVEEMKKMGKTVDYLEFPDDGHSPRKMSNQIRLHERAIGWLTRYLPDV